MACRHLFMPLRPLGTRNSGLSLQTTGYRPIRPATAVARRFLASQPPQASSSESISEYASDSASSKSSSKAPSESSKSSSSSTSTAPPDWEDNPNYDISHFSELPHTNFGVNQHIVINDEFKEALRQILWQFRAPIRYAFAYGSGVFPQSKQTAGSSSSTTSIHSKAPPAVVKAQGGTPKMIDFIFGVSYTQHWHSLNLHQHRDHYSALGSLGSGAVSAVQEKWGAGVYFNPFVTVNGTLIKYGVVNLDTLCTDLSEWNSLYLAGRLQKPVKILRDDPRVRLANQVNLLSALRTALLLLPPEFTEQELYGVIANISYMGDPRMAFPTEDKSKVANIVGHNLPHFRRLYSPLIDNLPNVSFNDPKCSDPDWAADSTSNVSLAQDMDPIKRGNMVRRLPKAFREKLYFQYQKKYQIPRAEFNKMLESSSDEDATRINRRQGGGFERRIANEPPEDLRAEVRYVIKKTIGWPSTSQSLKGILTSGIGRSWRYMSEKMSKYREGKRKAAEAATEKAKEASEKQKSESEEKP
ncbi:Mitochondrial translocator assembly and maintenance protein 41 [Cadophora gregata]|uniref:Mitochondrial translocator assembly and maintenance protein 41 n=1 Tax=Cadophora gregata TaxID=51156 RepID=UPI0026DD5D99|nr:Mitochondrial translocator assembly and maintenance protein 41 [Cadophora gregata]KAK0102079.1 Mitochondrial translocator assembly and maintenance protein 41 [Cadophora gregata f. sp. sojae]KAK0129186.1 Mitochondrial translocator assembly and maintenance protein 41 [Cadophora gregata]